MNISPVCAVSSQNAMPGAGKTMSLRAAGPEAVKVLKAIYIASEKGQISGFYGPAHAATKRILESCGELP